MQQLPLSQSSAYCRGCHMPPFTVDKTGISDWSQLKPMAQFSFSYVTIIPTTDDWSDEIVVAFRKCWVSFGLRVLYISCEVKRYGDPDFSPPDFPPQS